MRYLKIGLCLLMVASFTSCGETHKQDNVTGDPDTMVIKQDQTDSATNTVTTDTTKR
jgi:hypothetical protein